MQLSAALYALFMIGATKSFLVRHSIRRSATLFQHMSSASSTTLTSGTTANGNALSSNLIIIIAGPTGVGKSNIAARICADHGGVIVSADSVQAYRGVQIGANKPTLEERAETPHLLVDMVDASEQYNAADWRRDALTCMELLLNKDPTDLGNPNLDRLQKEISDARHLKGYDAKSGVLPVVVGGTMMYLQWLVHGRPDASRPTDLAIQKAQEKIEHFQAQESNGWEKAIEYVAALNPIFETRVQSLSGRDWYRLRRTMEIAYTALEQDSAALIDSLYSGEREGGLAMFGFDVRCFFVCPNDRMSHTVIVDQRCEEMILRGLLRETTDLAVSNALPEMATKAIGYRQVLEYLRRPYAKPGDADAFDAFLNDFTTATRRYAKKQMQWFRKDNAFAFVPVSLQTTKEERVEIAATRISDLCLMSRQDYEAELLPMDSADNVPASFQARLVNELQGKNMKFYQFQRYKLKKGSLEFESLLKEADECGVRLEEHFEQKSFNNEKRPRLL
jgi:tRNA dimethylallyltransferase